MVNILLTYCQQPVNILLSFCQHRQQCQLWQHCQHYQQCQHCFNSPSPSILSIFGTSCVWCILNCEHWMLHQLQWSSETQNTFSGKCTQLTPLEYANPNGAPKVISFHVNHPRHSHSSFKTTQNKIPYKKLRYKHRGCKSWVRLQFSFLQLQHAGPKNCQTIPRLLPSYHQTVVKLWSRCC